MTNPLYFTEIPSPLGLLTLTASIRGLTGLFMEGHRHGPRNQAAWRRDETRFGEVTRQLAEYFAGRRRRFDVPVAVDGGTEFQRRVWTVLPRISYGETWSYAQVAAEVGSPKASRAVGLANGRNPLSIIVPCHRVVGANGSLTGYSGGLERKRFLLSLERGSPEAGAPWS